METELLREQCQYCVVGACVLSVFTRIKAYLLSIPYIIWPRRTPRPGSGPARSDFASAAQAPLRKSRDFRIAVRRGHYFFFSITKADEGRELCGISAASRHRGQAQLGNRRRYREPRPYAYIAVLFRDLGACRALQWTRASDLAREEALERLSRMWAVGIFWQGLRQGSLGRSSG
jgi:hypothetical protein